MEKVIICGNKASKLDNRVKLIITGCSFVYSDCQSNRRFRSRLTFQVQYQVKPVNGKLFIILLSMPGAGHLAIQMSWSKSSQSETSELQHVGQLPLLDEGEDLHLSEVTTSHSPYSLMAILHLALSWLLVRNNRGWWTKETFIKL